MNKQFYLISWTITATPLSRSQLQQTARKSKSGKKNEKQFMEFNELSLEKLNAQLADVLWGK